MNAAVGDTGLRARVLRGEVLLGTFLNLGAPLAAEACAMAGYDWLVVDLEHGAGGEDALLGQLLAADAHDVPVVVRVETAARIRAGHALDLGATGVMYPRLETLADVQAAVRHLRYPPLGDRGVATYNRACGFGRNGGALESAADRVVGVVQIESPSAVEQLEEIAKVPGVDVLFVGPRDLSHALGVPGRFDNPAFRAALNRVVEVGRSVGIAPGIMANGTEAAARLIDAGFTFVAVNSDSSMLAATAAAALSAIRNGRP